jgi:hypothetical protein
MFFSSSLFFSSATATAKNCGSSYGSHFNKNKFAFSL